MRVYDITIALSRIRMCCESPQAVCTAISIPYGRRQTTQVWKWAQFVINADQSMTRNEIITEVFYNIADCTLVTFPTLFDKLFVRFARDETLLNASAPGRPGVVALLHGHSLHVSLDQETQRECNHSNYHRHMHACCLFALLFDNGLILKVPKAESF